MGLYQRWGARLELAGSSCCYQNITIVTVEPIHQFHRNLLSYPSGQLFRLAQSDPGKNLSVRHILSKGPQYGPDSFPGIRLTAPFRDRKQILCFRRLRASTAPDALGENDRS